MVAGQFDRSLCMLNRQGILVVHGLGAAQLAESTYLQLHAGDSLSFFKGPLQQRLGIL